MDALWTWGGKHFGYRVHDALYTWRGKHIGCFYGAEVFSLGGDYLGEIRGKNRLLVDTSKADRREGSCERHPQRGEMDNLPDLPEYTMYGNISDFPSADAFG